MNQTANSLNNILQEVLSTTPTAHPNNPTCSCHIINPKVHRLIFVT